LTVGLLHRATAPGYCTELLNRVQVPSTKYQAQIRAECRWNYIL